MFYLLYQSKGRTVAIVAVIEMGKSVVTLTIDLGEYIKKIIRDVRESDTHQMVTDAKELWSHFFHKSQKLLKILGLAQHWAQTTYPRRKNITPASTDWRQKWGVSETQAARARAGRRRQSKSAATPAA
jgi:hypothetical protein